MCVLTGAPGVRSNKKVRMFRTVTRDLEALRDWLKGMGVTHVGLEITRPLVASLGCLRGPGGAMIKRNWVRRYTERRHRGDILQIIRSWRTAIRAGG